MNWTKYDFRVMMALVGAQLLIIYAHMGPRLSLYVGFIIGIVYKAYEYRAYARKEP